MMGTKRTEGLWENAGRISDSDSRLLITSESGDIAIVACADPDEELANARLIAAAPELLAMVERFDTIMRGMGPLYASGEFAKEVAALLAKATGEVAQ